MDEVDLAFSALPHKASAEAILPLLEKNIRVIDISADFRLKDSKAYETWYDFTHPAPQLLQNAVYGLPELHREEIRSAKVIANPGCYPTGAILALAPAVREGIIESGIIVDGKSGLSGAGRSLTLTTHFTEANENACAYALSGHRHFPEISQELSSLTSTTLDITFLPHLIPMTRGILSSCYAKVKSSSIADDEKGKEQLIKLYRNFYKNEPFVRVVDNSPQTKQTWGTNLCLIHPTVDQRTGRLIVISAIDNLIKGAAGQAIQNMNLMMGFPEIMGLESFAVYP